MKLFITCTFFLCTLVVFGQQKEKDSLQNILANATTTDAKTAAHKQLTLYAINKDTAKYSSIYKAALLFSQQNKNPSAVLDLKALDAKKEYRYRNIDAALEKADALLPELTAVENLQLKADMHHLKGNIYADKLDYAEAAVHFYDKLEATKKLGNTDKIARSYHNLGWALMSAKNYNKALEYFSTSIHNQKEFEPNIMAHTYWNMGICYMEQEMYLEALAVLNKGYHEAVRVNDMNAAAGNQTCIASVYVRQDKFNEGLQAYKKAYDMAVKANQSPYKIIESLNGIIYSYNQLAQPDKATPFIAKADSIIEKNEYSDLRTRQFLFQKTNNLLQRGLPQEADIYFLKYERAYDSLRDTRNQAMLQEKEALYKTKEKEQQLLLKEEELKNQRLYTGLLAGGAILLGLILFLLIRQRSLKAKQQVQEEKLKNALHAIETTNKLEEQRLRISKELHDNIGSQLTYLASATQNIEIGIDTYSKEETKTKLMNLSTFSQDAIRDLRDTIWVMNKTAISTEGLTERLRNLAYKAATATGIDISVNKEGPNEQLLDSNTTLNLFRILQEALNNAVKHSNATKITVAIFSNAPMSIKITDNGDGFDTKNTSSDSNGLINMKSRAQKINATLDINSSEKGTVLEIIFNK